MQNTVVINLGWCVAKIEPNRQKLTILSPSDTSGGQYIPAQDVIVFGDGLIALRDALNALELRQPQNLRPAVQQEDPLRAALERLERACDKRASLLTPEAYCTIEAIPEMREANLELDRARKAARSALSDACGG